jgi:hypothetical protein
MQHRNRIPIPLIVIAAPAAVAIWSGWVGLGGMCGFGVVNLLPGIGGGFHLNTAITLPVGVEAYAAYALGAWMSPGTPGPARRFAQWSAFGALAYGMLGQVVYHLLAAAGVTQAPWPVVVVVSCVPVVVLGCAAALTHLIRRPQEAQEPPAELTLLDTVPATVLAAAELALRATKAAGNALSQNQLQERFSLTRAQSRELVTKVLAESNGYASGGGD